jgi:hypothetical protein
VPVDYFPYSSSSELRLSNTSIKGSIADGRTQFLGTLIAIIILIYREDSMENFREIWAKVRAVRLGHHTAGFYTSRPVSFSPVSVIRPVLSAKPCNLRC